MKDVIDQLVELEKKFEETQVIIDLDAFADCLKDALITCVGLFGLLMVYSWLG